MGTHLYLIRHGQAYTQLDRARDDIPVQVGGMRGDRGLTPLGRVQAEHLRDRLAATGELRADVVLASTFPRARQTAEIVAPALGLVPRFDDDLQEVRPGEADGLLFAEFERRYGAPDLLRDPYRPLAPGGESWGQFVLRVGATLNRIAREHAGETVVAFTHGGVIDASFLLFLGMHALTPPGAAFHTCNTSITHWERLAAGGNAPAPWRLLRYNDDLHARGSESGRRIEWPRELGEPEASGEGPSLPLPTEPGEPG